MSQGQSVIRDVLEAYPNRTHHHDVRRGGDCHRPRPRRALRQVRRPTAARARPRTVVRRIDERAIKAHADLRFRSEYDYALFEYYRSAKVIAFLERAGVPMRGRVLDAGCGGGGMPLSLAEEAGAVVGIDPAERFQDAGVTARARARAPELHFAQADGMALPFPDRHVRPGAVACGHRARRGRAALPARVRARAGAGRARVSVDGAVSVVRRRTPAEAEDAGSAAPDRRTARRVLDVQNLARHAPWTLREPANENSFIKAARRGEVKHDDLLEKVRVRRLRAQIAASGLRSSARSCT